MAVLSGEELFEDDEGLGEMMEGGRRWFGYLPGSDGGFVYPGGGSPVVDGCVGVVLRVAADTATVPGLMLKNGGCVVRLAAGGCRVVDNVICSNGYGISLDGMANVIVGNGNVVQGNG